MPLSPVHLCFRMLVDHPLDVDPVRLAKDDFLALLQSGMFYQAEIAKITSRLQNITPTRAELVGPRDSP